MKNKRWGLSPLPGVVVVSVCCAGLLLAATNGIVITTPGEADGIRPAFVFRPDVPFKSLKQVAIWNELEQMLDRPYALGTCPTFMGLAISGNAQRYPARCTTIRRRHSFLPPGCTYDPSTGLPPCNDALLPPFLVHPLNYNPVTGEQSRILDPAFPGVASFIDPSGRDIGPISAGNTRIRPGDPAAIDYNSPLVADSTSGGDAGEPAGYAGASVCGNDPISGWVENRPACVGNTGRLFDPTIDPATSQPRGIIVSLRKPTVGQAYTVNSQAALAARPQDLEPSNPSDYTRDRQMATVLGKALFWDMQLGSDGTQACATCHFSAGADNRVRDSLNPDTLGGDSTLQIFRNRHLTTAPTAADQDVNRDLIAADFPTHKLRDESIPGEPLLNPSNVLHDANDIVSSMGVRLRRFSDIPTPGSAAFSAANNGVRALLPDIGATLTDPIPIFQNRRRVEPRNTSTIINAALNYDNFWDGRARHDFNGGSVFGASDPQSHVIVDAGGGLVQTRQIIRFASVASQMLGPAVSEFEMSFRGRNWAKIGKKMLQGDGSAALPRVTPLAGQLVSTSDSELGPFSNQGGSQCRALGRPTATGRPGLCVTYREMIEQAFFPQLWANTSQHLNGAAAACTSANNGAVSPAGCDPFDGFVLAIASGPASPTNRLQFTQEEANFSLFSGLALQAWMETQISDDTPFDRFLELNPKAFTAFTSTMPLCSQVSNRQPCLRETAGFNKALPPAGTPDRLLGMDLFFGTNLSGRNANFRTARCGGCHAGGVLTDHSIESSNKLTLEDFVPEFIRPGTKLARKPMGRPRGISGFLLEAAINGNAANGMKRNLVDQSLTPEAGDGLSRPQGAAFFDNGVYNIAVRPIDDDILRGGTDAWGWPLSISALVLKNLGGVGMVPGTQLPTFDPNADSDCAPDCVTGGLFARTAQDSRINPGFSSRPLNPRLPSSLAPWVNSINVGNFHPEADEVAGGLNTLTQVPLLDGYLDILGPFNPAARLNQQPNAAQSWLMGTFDQVNRVANMGAAKVPSLRNVELTGPYFHNGGKLTLRQVVNFYAHGSDFPITNHVDRVFNILNLDADAQSRLTSPDRIALVAFLLSLTDERVAHEQAPFDRPEIFLPVDGRAPDNTAGRTSLLSQSTAASSCGTAICFRRLTAVGAAGHANRLPGFLNVTSTIRAGSNNDHFDQ